MSNKWVAIILVFILLSGTLTILCVKEVIPDNLNPIKLLSHNSKTTGTTHSSDTQSSLSPTSESGTSPASSPTLDNSPSASKTYSDRLDTATINITTNSSINSSETYTDCTISVSDCDDAYKLNSKTAGIRLRGNTTQNFSKKPYRIKFEEKIQLLGLSTGPSKSWVLLAEYCDNSLLNNTITYNLGNRLDGIDFCPDCMFVNLVLNGESQGIYVLTEQIQVNENRVNIDESGVDDASITDTGYLLELEASSERRNSEGNQGTDWFGVTGYANSGSNNSFNSRSMEHSTTYDVAYYIIKSDAKSSAQINYIQNYMISVYYAIYKTKDYDTINSLVDLDSAVDMYILQLISNDYDNNFSSSFVYKDKGGKLCFGPPWDFDLAYGNYSGYTSTSTTYMFHLLKDLDQFDWFNTLVQNRFSELNTGSDSPIQHMVSSIGTYSNTLSSAFNNDFSLWHSGSSSSSSNQGFDSMWGGHNQSNNGWRGNGGGMNHGVSYSSWSEATSALTSWLNERIGKIN